MSASPLGLYLFLAVMVTFSWTFILTQTNESFWEADLTAACGTLNDTDCVDRHMSAIWSNLTRLYNPEGAIYSNLSYLDHHLYKPKTEQTHPNDTLANILKLYPGNYSDEEIDIIKAFPRRN